MLLSLIALGLSPSSAPASSRRAAIAAAASAAALAAISPTHAAHALKPCPPGANNCFSTASTDKSRIASWVWPKSMTRADAIASLESVLKAYPQTGVDGVDGGGWSLADDQMETSGFQRYEFKSAGTGNLARFFNGGKPFVDDFEVAVEPSSVCIRSSSRLGDSDFGVNAKRVNYIARTLRDAGWDAPSI